MSNGSIRFLNSPIGPFYEKRTPELQLVNPDLNEDIYPMIEDAAT
jgi:hypothetical protein